MEEDLAYQFKNALIKSKRLIEQPTLKSQYTTVYDYIKCYTILAQNKVTKRHWYPAYRINPIPHHLLDWYYKVVRPKNICDYNYQSVQVVPLKYWTQFKSYFKEYIGDRDDMQFKIELVSVRIRKRIKTDYVTEGTNYYYQDSGFIKVEDNHFIKKSNTDVVYHYYGSNNRTKHDGHNKHRYSTKCRFYKRQLEYKGWFYDLPIDFDIRKDWIFVYEAYLTYLQQ